MAGRDNFTKRTIDILAKRVGFLCSNPNCRKHTIGPNENPQKATLIGIAAHITAASPTGPRFNNQLSEAERIHIDNGIWLCSNCAMLIDKDEYSYPDTLLKEWKYNAEYEMLNNLLGKKKSLHKKATPFLEADLIWNRCSRINAGYSDKNPTIFKDGRKVMLINSSSALPIIYWELRWHFTFTIHNNSSFPAYNVAIENIGNKQFVGLTRINAVNNIPPFKTIDLEADYFHFLEGDHMEADKIIKQKLPKELNGLMLKLTYQDDERITYSTIVEFKNNLITNIRVL